MRHYFLSVLIFIVALLQHGKSVEIDKNKHKRNVKGGDVVGVTESFSGDFIPRSSRNGTSFPTNASVEKDHEMEKLPINQYRLEEESKRKRTVKKETKRKNKKHKRRHRHKRRRRKRMRSRKEKKKNRKRSRNIYGRQNSIKLKNSIDLVVGKTPKLYRPTDVFNDFLHRKNEVQPKNNRTEEFKRRILVYKGKKRRRFNHHQGVKKLIVRTHNILRGKVQPPATNMLVMTWNQQAAKQAQSWAEQCHLGRELENPSVRWTPFYGTCGQNIHVAYKKKRWSRVIRLWWSEKRNFLYGYSYNNMTKVGQYTQMVWYNSHKVGCGFSRCSSSTGKMFYRYVCNYCPTGNDPRRLGHPYVQGNQCSSCPKTCRSVCEHGRCKLCSNSCPFSDLWSNCSSLATRWKKWLCNTKTADGVIRFKNCRATCQCSDKIL